MQSEVQRSIPALERSPASVGRDLGLLTVESRLGKFESANKQWEKFNKIALSNVKVNADYYDRAVSEYDREEYSNASHDFDKWLTKHPNDFRSRYLLSITYSLLSKQIVEHMVSLDPNSIRIHQLVAQSYENNGDEHKALDEYKIIEKMNPNLPGIHYEMGNLLWKSEDSNEALAELQKELILNPDHAEANAELGTILVNEHSPISAIPYLLKAIKLAPDLTLIHQQLGEAYYMEKQYPKAENELRKAIADDKNGSAHYLLGSVYRSEGNIEKAKEEFATAQRIKSNQIKLDANNANRLDLTK